MVRRMRLIVLLSVAGPVVSSCGSDDSPVAASFGVCCTSDSQCGNGICDEAHSHCSMRCTSDSDCPDADTPLGQGSGEGKCDDGLCESDYYQDICEPGGSGGGGSGGGSSGGSSSGGSSGRGGAVGGSSGTGAGGSGSTSLAQCRTMCRSYYDCHYSLCLTNNGTTCATDRTRGLAACDALAASDCTPSLLDTYESCGD